MSKKKRLREIKAERNEITGRFTRIAEFVGGFQRGQIVSIEEMEKRIISRIKKLEFDLNESRRLSNKFVCKTNRFQQVLEQLSKIDIVSSKFPDAFLTPQF